MATSDDSASLSFRFLTNFILLGLYSLTFYREFRGGVELCNQRGIDQDTIPAEAYSRVLTLAHLVNFLYS